jgi:hypothetical protein
MGVVDCAPTSFVPAGLNDRSLAVYCRGPVHNRIRPVGCGMIWVGRSPYNPRLNKDGLPTSRPVVNHGAQNHTIPPGRIVYGHTFLAVNRQATIIQSLRDEIRPVDA